MEQKQQALKLEYILINYQRIYANSLPYPAPICTRIIKGGEVVIFPKVPRQANNFLSSERQYFQEVFKVDRSLKASANIQLEYVVVSYERVYGDFIAQAITIRTYEGIQGEIGICPKSEAKMTAAIKNFISSNQKQFQAVLAVDRSLFFAPSNQLAEDCNSHSHTEKPDSKVISIFKNQELGKVKSLATSPAPLAVKNEIVIAPNQDKKTLTKGKITKKLIAIPAGLGLGLLLGLGGFFRPNNLAFTTALLQENFSERSETVKPNNYVKNNAISHYLSSGISPQTLAISPERSTLAIAENNRVLLADLLAYASPKKLELFENRTIEQIALSADLKVAIALKNGWIKVFNSQGELVTKFKNNYPISALSFSTDSESLLVGDLSGIVQIFSLNQEDKIVRLIGHSAQINQIIASKERIITASSDTTIRIWNSSGEEIKSFKDSNEVFAIAEDKQGNIYSGNIRGTIRKWHPNQGEIEIYQWQEQKITSLAVAKNILVSGSNDRSVMILDLLDRNNKKIFTHLGHSINFVGIAKNGKTILASNNKEILAWEYYELSE